MRKKFSALITRLLNGFRTTDLGEEDGVRNAANDGVCTAQCCCAGVGVCREDLLALEAARVAEEKYRLIFENAIEGIFQTTPDGRYLSANPRLAKIYGYDSPDSLMQSLQDIQHQLYVDPGRRAEFVRLMDEHDEIRDFESQIRRKDGLVIWISENARAIRDRNGRMLYYEGTVEDITHRKQAAALEAEKEAAVAANKAKSAFLAHMSHEIRTPLNGVLGMLQLLHQTTLDARQLRYVQIARSSADNLLAIINDVLDFSKIEAGKLELELLPFNLHDLLEEVTEMFSQRAHAQQLELYCRTTPDVPAAVRGDAQRLRQVLINLLGNALKFTQQGTISLRAEVLERQHGNALCRLSVQDTGIGIPAERRDRLFAPFSQVDGSTTRKFGGTGLGLAICRQIVELMGGQIAVVSEVGQGSTFTLTVPLALAEESGCTVGKMPELKGLRVLVADEKMASVAVLRELLDCWGMRVETLDAGQAAVERMCAAVVAGSPFAAVVVAHNPPEQDALALARQIRQQAALAPTPIFVLDSMDTTLDRSACDAAGVTLLTKPVRQSRLFDVLATSLQGQCRPRQWETGKHAERSLALDAAAEPSMGKACRPDRLSSPLAAKILVAEDNDINQLVTSEILRSGGYDCELVATGQQAIDALRREPFSLVLMDCHMPDLDGFDATWRIRELEAAGELSHATAGAIPIIALTANAVRGDREQCLAAGMNDYATKPVDRAQILRLIAHYLPARPETNVSWQAEKGTTEATDAIDRQSLLDRCGGSESFAHELLTRFRDKLPMVCRDVADALSRSDDHGARRHAHTLKGLAGNMGAIALSRAAGSVEDALAEEGRAAAGHSLLKLERETLRCLDELQRLLERELASP